MAFDLGGVLTSVGGGLFNNFLQNKSFDKQVQAQKDLMKYQWNNFGSPQALAKSYAAAGFNPAAVMSNGSLSAAQPNAAAPSAPMYSTGMENLSELGSYLLSIAQAKKAGVDTKVSEEEARNKVVQRQRDEFELELRKYFAHPQVAMELATSYQNLVLAQDTHDLNEINKAIAEWNKAKSKAESQASEHNRDILKKILDNKDTELKLANRESEARGTASYAAAEASRTQAILNRESASKVKSEAYYQALVNSLKDGIYTEEFDAMLADARARKQISESEEQQAKHLYNRYNHLNENDKEKAAEYLNYMFWFFKNEMPSLPIVPFLKLGK